MNLAKGVRFEYQGREYTCHSVTPVNPAAPGSTMVDVETTTGSSIRMSNADAFECGTANRRKKKADEAKNKPPFAFE